MFAIRYAFQCDQLQVWYKTVVYECIFSSRMLLFFITALWVMLCGGVYIKNKCEKVSLCILKDLIISAALSVILTILVRFCGKPYRHVMEYIGKNEVVIISAFVIIALLYQIYQPRANTSNQGNTRNGFLSLIFRYGSALGFAAISVYVACLSWMVYQSMDSISIFVLTYVFLGTYVLMTPKIRDNMSTLDRTDPIAFNFRKKLVRECVHRMEMSCKNNLPCNIAVIGKSGSGKTCLASQIFLKLKKKILSKTEKDYTLSLLEFDLRHFSSSEDIHSAFVQRIHRTIYPQSCFSSLFRSSIYRFLMPNGQARQCYEALEQLVLSPESENSPDAIQTIQEKLDQNNAYIVVFIDDVTSAQAEILRQFKSIIDSISRIKHLSFFVTLNSDALTSNTVQNNEIKTFMQKFFYKIIELPDLSALQCYKYMAHRLQGRRIRPALREDLLHVFDSRGHGESQHKRPLEIIPSTPRALIQATDLLIKFASRRKGSRCPTNQSIMCIFLLFLKQEAPMLYRKIRGCSSDQYAQQIRNLSKNVLTCKAGGCISIYCPTELSHMLFLWVQTYLRAHKDDCRTNRIITTVLTTIESPL